MKKTMDVLTSLPENLKELSLTEEEMDGYILNTYAIVTYPRGFWGGLMNQMSLDFLGLDISRRAEMIDDIRNTTVDLLPEAADHIAKVMETATLDPRRCGCIRRGDHLQKSGTGVRTVR